MFFGYDLEGFCGFFVSAFVVGDFVYIFTISLVCWDAARGCVRLVDEPFVFERSHVVADCGRGYVEVVFDYNCV